MNYVAAVVEIPGHVSSKSSVDDFFLFLDIFAKAEHVASIMKSFLSFVCRAFTHNLSHVLDHYGIFLHTFSREKSEFVDFWGGNEYLVENGVVF